MAGRSYETARCLSSSETMFRLIGGAALFPLLVVLLWDDAPEWVVLGAWAVGGAIVLVGLFGGRLVPSCPFCGKGVKLGATHCHHCGRQVVEG